MSRCRGLPAAERGFTLLELLVAITLLGLLMAALFGGLRLGTRVWETADARLEASVRIQIVQDFIRQRLAEALPLEGMPPELAEEDMPPELAEEVTGEPLFQGTVEAVRFAGLLGENLGAGVYVMELALAEYEDSGDLVLRWHPLEPDDQTSEEIEPEERVLIENIEALELSYFGTIDPAQPPDWWQAWEGQPELPRLIRLRVRFADNDERRWPELIVRPMVDRALAFGF
jgi:general secretion pathway protein J